MIKINLLPKTLSQRLAVRNTAIAFAVALVAVIGAGVTLSVKMQGEVEKMEALASETEAYEARVKAIQDQTTSLVQSMKPIQEKLDFIKNVLNYNLQYPKLYEEIAKWTYEKVELTSMQSDGSTVNLQARVKTLDDLGRYLLNMYRATNLFTEVRITQASGFGRDGEQGQVQQQTPSSAGGEIQGSQATLAGLSAIGSGVSRSAETRGGTWINFTVVCKLKTPIVAPTFASAPTPTTPGAPPSPGAGPPGGFEPMAGGPQGRGQYTPDIERQMSVGQ